MVKKICSFLLLFCFALPVFAQNEETLDNFYRFHENIDPDIQKITPERDQIHEALLLIYPEYSNAFDRYNENEFDFEVFENLRREARDYQDPYLLAYVNYFLGRIAIARGEYREAAYYFEDIRYDYFRFITWKAEVKFYLAYTYINLPTESDRRPNGNNPRLNNLEEQDRNRGSNPIEDWNLPDFLDHEERQPERSLRRAESLLKSIERNYRSDTPERLVVGARHLLRELDGDGNAPLLGLVNQMNTIERQIRRGETDIAVNRQQDVIDEIDRLIELMEEQENNNNSNDNSQNPGQEPQRESQIAPESMPQSGNWNGESLNLREEFQTGELWRLLDQSKIRDPIMQYPRDNFPPQYRRLIERYYRAISEADTP